VSDAVELQAFLFRSAAVNRQLAVEPPEAETTTVETIVRFSREAQVRAAAMGKVYELLYCLENSIRELIESTLKEAHGPQDWWNKGVDQAIRRSAEKRAADDAKARWHGPRGESQLAYVDFPQYADIIGAQWPLFEPLLGDQAWVTYYFAELNRTLSLAASMGPA
jgi:hypothetical protein